jgi:hypothetical protein
VIGILIVIAFVFLGSQETIDDPSVSGGETQTFPAPSAREPTTTDP